MEVNPNPKEVGKRIREIRTKLGLSMEEFSSRIDEKAKSGTVSNWETGKNLPNNARIVRIAELGNVSTSYLLEGKSISTDEEEQLRQLFHIQDVQELNDLKRKIELTKGSPQDLERKEILEQRIYKYKNAGQETLEKLTDTHSIVFNVPAFETIYVDGAPINQPITKEEALKRFFDLKHLIRALVPQSTYEGKKLTHDDSELLLAVIEELQEKFEFKK